jgi:hypothetical protein
MLLAVLPPLARLQVHAHDDPPSTLPPQAGWSVLHGFWHPHHAESP